MKKRIWIDLDGVLADYESLNSNFEWIEKSRLYKKEIHKIEGSFISMPPIEDAVWAFNELNKYFSTQSLFSIQACGEDQGAVERI